MKHLATIQSEFLKFANQDIASNGEVLSIHPNYLKDHSNCPICGIHTNMTCRCRLGEKHCKNGHTWHTCGEHKKVFSGDSHKIGSLRSWSKCVCPFSEEEKTKLANLR